MLCNCLCLGSASIPVLFTLCAEVDYHMYLLHGPVFKESLVEDMAFDNQSHGDLSNRLKSWLGQYAVC